MGKGGQTQNISCRHIYLYNFIYLYIGIPGYVQNKSKLVQGDGKARAILWVWPLTNLRPPTGSTPFFSDITPAIKAHLAYSRIKF